MPRYFLEVAYNGTRYSGFQKQLNANTVQAEVEKAFEILHRQPVDLTGSSRTDAGVHALQNYFHFDFDGVIHSQLIYKLNAILPEDVVVKGVRLVADDAHCRFDARSREYHYRIFKVKNPFLKNFSFYFPYQLDMVALEHAADIVKSKTDFSSFCKTNTQVKNFNCLIYKSQWKFEGEEITYTIEGNRFLR
ncbi:MAG TPA: tRNA pseudouridine synthase A, partial [Chitinophagaceae bacterium]|nr:tRNA pseudouridine synthase A [Chitinophagaceae bacterium]